MSDIYKSEGCEDNERSISKIPLLVPKVHRLFHVYSLYTSSSLCDVVARSQVPQQRNGEDCGIFVLYFIHLFMQSAPEAFNLEDYPYFVGSLLYKLVK